MVWSYGGEGASQDGSTWEMVFDGKPTSQSFYNRGGDVSYTFPTGTSGELEVLIASAGSSTGTCAITAKGNTVNTTFTGVGQTETIKFGTLVDIGEITFSPTGIGALINAIKLNGELLVDGTPVWNTSEIWSNNLTGFIGATPAANAFDGNTSLSCERLQTVR